MTTPNASARAQMQENAALTVRDRVNLRRLPDWLVSSKASLRVDEVRGENGVDER